MVTARGGDSEPAEAHLRPGTRAGPGPDAAAGGHSETGEHRETAGQCEYTEVKVRGSRSGLGFGLELRPGLGVEVRFRFGDRDLLDAGDAIL